jgi:hypothetical protein
MELYLVGALVLFLPLAIVISVVFFWKQFGRRRRRRSPLTTELVRLPGQSLRNQIDDLSLDLLGYLTSVFVFPMMLFCILLMQSIVKADFAFVQSALIYGLAILIVTGWLTFKIISTGQQRQKLNEAVDAEISTAQDLEQLKPSGYRVFHDIQTGKFNIDHVVVGPSGVYAFETKSRLKPTDIAGKEGVSVVFDGRSLKFPTWTEVKPLEQAKRQALWLKKRLAESAGENVEVKPVLSLPGWFVERKAQGDVVVANPKNLSWISNTAAKLDEGQIKRIVFQLEQMSHVESR